MKQETLTYHIVIAGVMLALLASCKSPTEFDTPKNVDSTQVGDTVIPISRTEVFIPPFTQTIAVNGFNFFHDMLLGGDEPMISFAGTFAQKSGRATIGLALNVQHDPQKSYYGTAGLIPYQAVGFTLKMQDLSADSLSITTRSADESEGAATLTVAEYSPAGVIAGIKSVPAKAYVTINTIQVDMAQNSSQPIPMLQLQIRLTSTYMDDSAGNVFFYRIDGSLFIPWP